MSANARLYDELDLLYRELWGKSLHHGLWIDGSESSQQAREQLAVSCLIALDPQEGETIADIGCGYGTFSHRVVNSTNCQVHAFTNSLAQIDAAKPHPNITYHQADWLSHSLPDDSLDKAIALESLSHLPDFDAFFSITSKALRPGANLVVSDWYSSRQSSLIEKLLLRFLAKTGAIPPWRSLDQLRASASRAHFEIKHHQILSQQVAPTWSAFFKSACLLPFRKPALIPLLAKTAFRRPQLSVAFVLLRLSYHSGLLEYRLYSFTKITASPNTDLREAT